MMEHKMETTTVYWAYIGITEKNMETTLMGYIFCIQGVVGWVSLKGTSILKYGYGP